MDADNNGFTIYIDFVLLDFQFLSRTYTFNDMSRYN
jgi:hypothetical protein